MPPRRFVAEAAPTKDFFISMITRDIGLQDCILDLLDNSIDSARLHAERAEAKEKQKAKSKGRAHSGKSLQAYAVDIVLNSELFSISDNCGGMAIEDARHRVFRHGRPEGHAPGNGHGTIGYYGIGLKRAVFKIGADIRIESSTGDEGFVVPIDVRTWARDNTSWDLTLEEVTPPGPRGTSITVKRLTANVGDEFDDPVFVNTLRRAIGRDYAAFLNRGLSVRVNHEPVQPTVFTLLTSDALVPARTQYYDAEMPDVLVEITAGLSRAVGEDGTEDERDPKETANYGWFVACNDRVVLAGDKTARTVWGVEGMPAWHAQYNGFLGWVNFVSDDPSKLPWTTTKRDVDHGNPVYRNALVAMRDFTKAFTKYTNARKRNLQSARVVEVAARAQPIEKIAPADAPRFPSFRASRKKRAEADGISISYAVEVEDFEAVKEALGLATLSPSQVGLMTFRYFKKYEVGG